MLVHQPYHKDDAPAAQGVMIVLYVRDFLSLHLSSLGRLYGDIDGYRAIENPIMTISLDILYTKCCTKIFSLSDSSCLQNDLDSMATAGVLTVGLLSTSPKVVCFVIYNRSTSPIDATYHLGQTDISSQDHCKDLGIIFSSDLSWSHHYNRISAKAYRQLGLIRRTFSSSVSVRAKKLLYLSLVRS